MTTAPLLGPSVWRTTAQPGLRRVCLRRRHPCRDSPCARHDRRRNRDRRLAGPPRDDERRVRRSPRPRCEARPRTSSRRVRSTLPATAVRGLASPGSPGSCAIPRGRCSSRRTPEEPEPLSSRRWNGCSKRRARCPTCDGPTPWGYGADRGRTGIIARLVGGNEPHAMGNSRDVGSPVV